MRRLIVLVALLAAGCGSSPTAPTPAPAPVTPPVVTPPPIVSPISVSACPESIVGLELGFYRQIGCNGFDLPLQSVRRWNVAPKVYLKTVDEAGAVIDGVTLDTVQNAMIETAIVWTAGKFGLEGVLRGTDTREGQTGWITVKWPTITDPTARCGQADVAIDGGTIEFNYLVGGGCACGASKVRPHTARHELGHALGYWHTDNQGDLMSSKAVQGCDAQPSARERQAAAYQYR